MVTEDLKSWMICNLLIIDNLSQLHKHMYSSTALIAEKCSAYKKIISADNF